jgi:hypothetical protein
MKALSGKQYIIQWATQFSLRNKLLGHLDFNMDSFLPAHAVLVPFSSIELFGTKVVLLTFGNIET